MVCSIFTAVLLFATTALALPFDLGLFDLPDFWKPKLPDFRPHHHHHHSTASESSFPTYTLTATYSNVLPTTTSLTSTTVIVDPTSVSPVSGTSTTTIPVVPTGTSVSVGPTGISTGTGTAPTGFSTGFIAFPTLRAREEFPWFKQFEGPRKGNHHHHPYFPISYPSYPEPSSSTSAVVNPTGTGASSYFPTAPLPTGTGL